MTRLRADVVTYEAGRRVVRSLGFADLPAGALLRRLEVRAGDDLLAVVPFGLDEDLDYDDGDGE